MQGWDGEERWSGMGNMQGKVNNIYNKGKKKKKKLAKHQSLANIQKVFNTDNYLDDY